MLAALPVKLLVLALCASTPTPATMCSISHVHSVPTRKICCSAGVL